MKAFVLRRTSYGESDWIVEFLLESGERSSVFVPAGQKSFKRYAHQFQPTAIYDVELTAALRGGSMKTLKRCDLSEMATLLMSVDRFQRWAVILEWIKWDEQKEISFEEMKTIWKSFQGEDWILCYFEFFKIQMKRQGLLPSLKQCAVCHQLLDQSITFVSERQGFCHLTCASGIAISPTMKKFFDNTDYELSSRDVMLLDQILVPFLETQLERNFKSHRFLLSNVSI